MTPEEELVQALRGLVRNWRTAVSLHGHVAGQTLLDAAGALNEHLVAYDRARAPSLAPSPFPPAPSYAPPPASSPLPANIVRVPAGDGWNVDADAARAAGFRVLDEQTDAPETARQLAVIEEVLDTGVGVRFGVDAPIGTVVQVHGVDVEGRQVVDVAMTPGARCPFCHRIDPERP